MPGQLVSICIPAYENAVLLKRLLDSIAIQTYSPIEVIVSDDSAGEDIKNALSGYTDKLSLKYFRNNPALKSPGNWNNALDKASGELLMLVHQDDWFKETDALENFVEALEKNTSADFAFSRSMAFSDDDARGLNRFHKNILEHLKEHPEGLLLGNVIGPPSNVMVRKSAGIRYAKPFIWLVDVDYYLQLLKTGHRFVFIDKPLVAIGLHDEQATKYVEQNKHIILKEHLLLAANHGERFFSDWRIYDLYWRLIRNFNIRKPDDLAAYGIETNNLPAVIKQIIERQHKIPQGLLRTGVGSKIFMWLGFRNKK